MRAAAASDDGLDDEIGGTSSLGEGLAQIRAGIGKLPTLFKLPVGALMLGALVGPWGLMLARPAPHVSPGYETARAKPVPVEAAEAEPAVAEVEPAAEAPAAQAAAAVVEDEPAAGEAVEEAPRDNGRKPGKPVKKPKPKKKTPKKTSGGGGKAKNVDDLFGP